MIKFQYKLTSIKQGAFALAVDDMEFHCTIFSSVWC